MKKVVSVFLLALMYLYCFSGTSFGETIELVKLVENKNFWATYKWGVLDESELFKTNKFNLAASNYENKYDFYEADIKMDSIDAKFKIKTENNKHIDMYFTYLPNSSINEYNKLYQWCINKYGNTHIDYESSKKAGVNATATTKETSWIMNDTVIQLVTSYVIIENQSIATAKKDNGLITKYISLVYKEKDRAKINKPTVALSCKVNYSVKSVKVIKFKDVNIIIDENTNEVMNSDHTNTDWALKVTDNAYELDKSDASNNSVHLDINRLNWKLAGESIIANSQKPYRLKGSCKMAASGKN